MVVTKPFVWTRTVCGVCDGDVEPLLWLGQHVLADFVDAPGLPQPEVPLIVDVCPECHLFQLRHVVERDALFRKYWYRSGTNATMKGHLKALAEDVQARAGLKQADVVVDIGSNDGTFLNNFRTGGLLGFEPAFHWLQPIGRTVKTMGDWNYVEGSGGPEMTVISNYFSRSSYHNVMGDKKAKVITAIAMFYDLVRPQEFIQDVRDILANDGWFVIEMNYVKAMLQNTAFDIIGHEHVNLYFISTLNRLLRPEGLEVKDVSQNTINGGSMRLWIGHMRSGVPTASSVDAALYAESKVRTMGEYRSFAREVDFIRARLNNLLLELRLQGKRIYAKGASTRGFTTLQACGLTNKEIDKAIDINPAKVGKYMAGLDIPIIAEDDPDADTPDVKLVLPWGFLDEFRKKEAAYLQKGGKLLVPFPEPRMLHA